MDSVKEVSDFESRESFLEYMRPLWAKDRQVHQDGSLNRAANIFERISARVAGSCINKSRGLPVDEEKLQDWQSRFKSLQEKYPEEWEIWTFHDDVIGRTLKGIEKGLITEEDLRLKRLSRGEL